MSRLFTVDQTSTLLNVHPKTVYKWKAQGLLTFVDLNGLIRFKEEDIEDLLKNCTYKRSSVPGHTPTLNFILDGQVGCDIMPPKGGSGMKSKESRCYCGNGSVYPRKTKEKKIRWYVDYRTPDGKRIQRVVKNAQTREEAIFALQVEVQEGYDRRYYPNRKKKKIMFKEFADMYLNNYAKTNKKSWKTDMYYLRGMIESFGDLYLTDVNSLVVEKYKTDRLNKGVRPSTVNRCLAIIKKMMNLAVDWGFLEHNQINKVKLFPEKDNLKERILTKEEEESLIMASAEHLRSILIIALNTGMRRGEILNLQWSQIDLDVKRIRVEKTKSGKIRVIDINYFLMDEVLKLKKENRSGRYLFVNPKTGKPLTTVKTAFKAACRRAGIKGLRFHDMRHTFASRLIEKGINIITVKELLGHSSVKVTERYTHVLQEQKKRAVELLAEEPKERVLFYENLLHGSDMGEKEKKEKPLTSLFSVN